MFEVWKIRSNKKKKLSRDGVYYIKMKSGVTKNFYHTYSFYIISCFVRER